MDIVCFPTWFDFWYTFYISLRQTRVDSVAVFARDLVTSCICYLQQVPSGNCLDSGVKFTGLDGRIISIKRIHGELIIKGIKSK